MGDNEKISPETIKMIVREFEKAIGPVRKEVTKLELGLRQHCMDTTIRTKKMDELNIAAQSTILSARDVIREVKDIPETVHAAAKLFYDESFGHEIKRIDDKIDAVDKKISAHLTSHESIARAQRRGIAVTAMTALVMTAIAVLSYFGIKLPGSK